MKDQTDVIELCKMAIDDVRVKRVRYLITLLNVPDTAHWSVVTGQWSMVTGHWSEVINSSVCLPAFMAVFRFSKDSRGFEALLLCIKSCISPPPFNEDVSFFFTCHDSASAVEQFV